MMTAARTAACPREDQIADFSRGKLDPVATETISAHLETCADCRSAAESVAADSFISRLRAAHGRDPDPPPMESQLDSVSRMSSATIDHRPAAPIGSSAHRANFPIPSELRDHADYELIKQLGQGGMGVVYLARNRDMDRLEVLKVVSQSLVELPDTRERFQREIRAAAKLSHPNIVAAYSVPKAGELLIFAMEYVPGRDLSQIVKDQQGPLPVTNAAYYAYQAALGLQHAHEQGMVHRDIKPNNLIMSVQGKRHLVKILDFGLAKASSEKMTDAGLTGSGQMLGTPDYVAPEQSLDAQKADIRADIYSLGCTLYFLLAGKPPFQGTGLYALLAAHHSNTARPLNEVRPEVPAELAAVVAKMMAKQPGDRYQSPAEVVKALGPFFRAGGPVAEKPESAATAPGPGPVSSATAAPSPPRDPGAAPPPAARAAGIVPPAGGGGFDGFDPYYQWLGIPPEEQPADHYRLLGAKRFETNGDVLANLADQRMSHLRTFQMGAHAAQSQKLLNEVAAARLQLLNPSKKAAYDDRLRQSLAALPGAGSPAAIPLVPVRAVPVGELAAPRSATAPAAEQPVTSDSSSARAAFSWITAEVEPAKSVIPPERIRAGGSRNLPPKVTLAGVAALGVLAVLGALLFKVRTPDGVLSIEVNEPNPDIVIDGHKATVRWDAGGKQAEISLPPGTRRVEVSKDGFTAIGKEVSIEQNGRRVLAAKLEPLETAKQAVAAPGIASKTEGSEDPQPGPPVEIATLAAVLSSAAQAADPWIVMKGGDGPGKGKQIVLISGDEEYRSEEALPQLGKILARHHGFKCTVLFAIDPKDGTISPTQNDNIPGLAALQSADLMIIATRFRNLPDEQMKFIDDYVQSGRPIIGMRTATHAFDMSDNRKYVKYSWSSEKWEGGFGRQVLGETWVNHHGHHGSQSTRGIIAPGQESNPILRGIKNGDIWGPTDVYEVHLPADCTPVVLGQVLEGMKSTDAPVVGEPNDPMMPVAWTKSYTGTAGKPARIFTTTMGAATDLESEGTRRILVNATYWAVGLENKIPEKSNVDLVGEFKPLPFGFGKFQKGVKPEDPQPGPPVEVATFATDCGVAWAIEVGESAIYYGGGTLGSIDLSTKKQSKFPQPGDTVCSLAISPDHRYLASGTWDSGAIELWNTRTHALVRQVGTVKPRHAVAHFSTDGQTILAAGGSECQILDLNGNSRFQWQQGDGWCDTAFQSDDKVEILDSTLGLTQRSSSTGKELRRNQVSKGPRDPAPKPTFGTVLIADRQHIFVGHPDGDVSVLNSNGEPEFVLQAHDASVMSLAVTEDGQYLLTGGGDGFTRFWDLTSRRQVWQRQHSMTTSSQIIGNLAFCGCNGGWIRVLQLDGILPTERSQHLLKLLSGPSD